MNCLHNRRLKRIRKYVLGDQPRQRLVQTLGIGQPTSQDDHVRVKYVDDVRQSTSKAIFVYFDGCQGLRVLSSGSVCNVFRAQVSHSRHAKLLYQLGRVDLLIVDVWAMAPLAEPERRDFLEICDARYQARSTLLTSQIPVASWHAQIGDPTIADSILDRLVHNAHRLELKGESMRKKRGPGRKENA